MTSSSSSSFRADSDGWMDGCTRSTSSPMGLFKYVSSHAGGGRPLTPSHRLRGRAMSHRLAVTYSVGPTSQANELFPACITVVGSFSEIGKGDRDLMRREESSNSLFFPVPIDRHRCHNDIFSQKDIVRMPEDWAQYIERERTCGVIFHCRALLTPPREWDNDVKYCFPTKGPSFLPSFRDFPTVRKMRAASGLLYNSLYGRLPPLPSPCNISE